MDPVRLANAKLRRCWQCCSKTYAFQLKKLSTAIHTVEGSSTSEDLDPDKMKFIDGVHMHKIAILQEKWGKPTANKEIRRKMTKIIFRILKPSSHIIKNFFFFCYIQWPFSSSCKDLEPCKRKTTILVMQSCKIKNARSIQEIARMWPYL